VITEKSSPDLTLVVHLLSPNGRYDQTYLRNYALLNIKDQLAKITGIGSVQLFGGGDYAMRIWLNPQKVAERNMTAGEVVDAIRRQNVQVAGGTVGGPPYDEGVELQLPIMAQGRLSEAEQFDEIIIKRDGGVVTRLKDVARVEVDAATYGLRSLIDNKEAGAIGIFQAPGSNAIEISDAVRARMDELKQFFPEGLDYTIVYDPTVFVRGSIEAVIELLAEAGVMPERPRALLEAADEDTRATKLPLLKRLMEFVLHHDQTAYLTRSRELAFLANTLLAGSSIQSRPFTPQEASDAAACICNLGLECWPARWPGATSQGASSPRELDTAMPPNAFLVDHDLVTAFEVGWSVLYRDVSLFVADQLMSTLADLHCVDADTRQGLRTLRRELVKQREAGTPWLARDAADVLAMLDMTAWISVLGLLDECPILPAALTAVLERRTTTVSPTAFEFISTTAQIGDIRLFMRTLPGVLSG
jgi:hypothetical protein